MHMRFRAKGPEVMAQSTAQIFEPAIYREAEGGSLPN
jgi:hypothetical protein